MIRITIAELLQSKKKLDEFKQSIAGGGVAVIPTDTLYGFAVAANCPAAVEKIYAIKNRDSRKPLILFLENFENLGEIGIKTDQRQTTLLKKCWPGALTAVLPCPQHPSVSAFSFPTLGIRVPGHKLLLELIKHLPCRLLTTSANRSGLPSDPDPEKFAGEFSDEVDWLVEDGILPTAQASTVVDLSCEPWRVLRQGVVNLEAYLSE
ncbi:MAG: L-threonylcarbamoyladenylate synthase [Candidatus Rifleibacteriota bacterium]